MGDARAAVWTAPGVLEDVELDIPAPPPQGLLLEVVANGICGTDLHLLHSAPTRPTVLGHEIVGRVLEVGTGGPSTDAAGRPVGIGDRVALFPWVPCGRCAACKRFGPGAAICTEAFVYGIPFERTGVGVRSWVPPSPGLSLTGGFASHLVVHPGTWFWRVPDTMSSARASLLDPLAVAVRAVAMARTSVGTWDEVLRADATVVVQGAGPVGLLVVAVLRSVGVRQVVVTGARPARLGAARRLGADHVLDVRTTSPDERRGAVLDLTEGLGADLTVDCTNDPDALREGIRMTRRLGTVIEVGNIVNSGREIGLDPAVDVCQRNLRLLGMSANPPQSYAEAMALLAREHLAFDTLITGTVPLSAASAALEQLQQPDAIKVVLGGQDDQP